MMLNLCLSERAKAMAAKKVLESIGVLAKNKKT